MVNVCLQCRSPGWVGEVSVVSKRKGNLQRKEGRGVGERPPPRSPGGCRGPHVCLQEVERRAAAQRGHAPHTKNIHRTKAKSGGTSILVASQRGRVGCVHRIKVVF